MAEKTYVVKGMDCADCALHVEKGARSVDGVTAARVDFATGLLHLEGQADMDILRKRLARLGYEIELREPTGAEGTGEKNRVKQNFWSYLLARRETRLALAGGALLAISFLLPLAERLAPGISPDLLALSARLIQAAALAIAGFPIARGAAAALWINREISINLLMSIAAIGAVAIGETAEAATLIFLFAISEALEGFTADRARRVLEEMGDLTPSTAILVTSSGEERVAVGNLRKGDEIVVHAGERIPMDGVVRAGASAVNQAPITGESLPIEKSSGNTVFAGTINGNGTLNIEVTHLAADTTIQRIIRMIEQAQGSRAPTQRFIDRFARVYTPAMVALAVLVASVPPLFFGEPFWNTPSGNGWLYRALALLVISCPCALVISAPVTVISAITAAARRGVLIKGGAFLEALAGIRTFAFDKTGTLTSGTPAITGIRAVDCGEGESGSCEACSDVLALAGALENRSSHPLARPVVLEAEARGLHNRYAPASEVTALTGSGVQGKVNGRVATVGSHALFDREHPHPEALCRWVEQAEARGETTMLVSDGDRVRGYIALADTVRESSREVVAALRSMGRSTAMLTGDNAESARAIGDQVGVDNVLSNLLPEDKVRAVARLVQKGPVAMVGDGINDTPALAAASLGIAMGGSASAQAMETADVVLMGGDLRALPFAVRLSEFARRLIRQNVAFSLATKLVFLLLAMAGITSLWLAVLADVGVSLLVTTNAMRANRFEAGSIAPPEKA